MKKQYKILNPIAYGGRRERGEVVSMDEDTAAAFGSHYVQEVGEVEEEVEEVESVEVSEDMTLDELKDEAKKRDLKVSGTKADLVERIALHDEGGEEEDGE